ncbi:Gcd10p-domain-containing protein [Pholiota conissans]|uniref:tRNA (adenine(58)-N(1))-methyltransferase non-catalytic subunit TRM6 n=1 Tax=Pholiota conissans TaxID=109636 RepID=A0A9P5YMU4_9AGAR|nr:Gcd10p-domain-containing protein [Pholiota conissans]
MSTFKTSKSEQKSRDPGIQSGDLVLVRLPKGDIRSVKVEKNTTVVIPKFGAFFANELVGQPYGLTYEIQDKKLTYAPPKTLEEIEDTDATNELINDGEFVQPLTVDEIQALKRSGVHASDIIKMQIEQHANYSLKTEYSKDKYKKRKEAKYSKVFATIEPTLYNVCEYWFAKDQLRLRDLRIDSLSQMLNLANVRPGGRYLAVDDASGILVAGILERLGGEGKLITICATDSPPAYPCLMQMNFPSSVTDVLISLNWATAEEDYTPILPPSDIPTEQVKSDRQKHRLNKRKAVTDLLNNTREELFAGEFDGLLIASEYDPYSIIERLSPYLGGSASMVVHSPFSQIIVELQAKLRVLPQFLCPTVSESWLRRYQVLPGRTHPMMAMSGTGGFLCHATKMYVRTLTN